MCCVFLTLTPRNIEDTVLPLKSILKTINPAILEVGTLRLKEGEICPVTELEPYSVPGLQL